jgi:hypothetical protein
MGFEAPGGFRIPVLRGVSILRHADCMTTTTLINSPVGTVTNPRAVERLIAGQPTSDSAGVKLLIDVYAATIPMYRHGRSSMSTTRPFCASRTGSPR